MSFDGECDLVAIRYVFVDENGHEAIEVEGSYGLERTRITINLDELEQYTGDNNALRQYFSAEDCERISRFREAIRDTAAKID